MKKILLLLLLLPLWGWTQESDIIWQKGQGKGHIIHLVQEGENLSGLAKQYSLPLATLATYNHLSPQTAISPKQKISIPLTGSNFIVLRGAKAAPGIVPVQYIVTESITKQELASKFNLAEATIDEWNGIQVDEFYEKDKVIIGWLKYQPLAVSSPVLTKTSPNLGVDSKAEKKPNPAGENIKTNIQPTQQPKPLNEKLKSSWKKFSTNFKPKEEKPQTTKVEETKTATPTQTKLPVNKDSNAAKLTLKEKWNLLVNGKDYKPEKSYRKPLLANNKNKPGNNTVVSKENTNTNNKNTVTTKTLNNPKPVEEVKKVEKKEEVITDKSTKKTTLSDRWKQLTATKTKPKENKKPVAAPKANEKPIVKNNNPSNNTEIKPTNNNRQSNIKKEVTKNPAMDKVKTGNSTKVTKTKLEKEKPVVDNKLKEEAVEDNEVVMTNTEKVATKVADSEPSTIITSDAKTIDLSNTKSGKASLFFSGPTGGKFYAVTNLAKRGSTIKITNTSNGKYVMAEVLNNLPTHDASKGLLLKLSDNAKLALGLKINNFYVKVNY